MPRASIQTARPALRRLPTRPSRVVQAVLRQLLPLVFLGQRLQLRNSTAAQRLAAEFLAQQNGERNLLIAFRHPSPRDPLVLADRSGVAFPGWQDGLVIPCPAGCRFGFFTTVESPCGQDR